MATEQLEQIFLPFEQVGDSKKQADGTGLGLAISTKIVELMNSNLEVQSQLGVGSTFCFEVTLAESTEWVATSHLTSKGIIMGYQDNSRTILVVDDRWENRAVIQHLLEPIGFEVLEASNGQEGLAQIAKTHPDLVITDLSMPVMNGFEMLKQLRQNPQWQALPVIVSSASVFEIDQEKSLAAGGNSFLAKPIQADVLLAQLQEQLRLEWIYESVDKSVNPGANQSETPTEIIPPSSQTLRHWLNLSSQGDLFTIQAEAENLVKTSPQYAAFANTVILLAEGFQTKKLDALIQQYAN